ncbi:hypothetical protein BH24ACT5_BH24ACT5_28650 [soil metagenome]
MSRPRPAFGRNQPGRLPATMLRALTAELSDPGRYTRAKRYARDGAVIEIDIQPGTARGLVLGSRREPYEVTVYVDPLDIEDIDAATVTASLVTLVPDRSELALACTCPDADGGTMCKHALAVMLVMADEVSVEPDVLTRWRTPDQDSPLTKRSGTRLRPRAGAVADLHASRAAHSDERAKRLGRTERPAPERVDILAPVLGAPAPIDLGATQPLDPLPVAPTPLVRADRADVLVDEVLARALTVLTRTPGARVR